MKIVYKIVALIKWNEPKDIVRYLIGTKMGSKSFDSMVFMMTMNDLSNIIIDEWINEWLNGWMNKMKRIYFVIRMSVCV